MDEEKRNYNSNEIKAIHTYQSDMAETVRENEASVIKIALAEQKKKYQDDVFRKAKGSPFKRFAFFFFGIIFIVGGVVGVYFVVKYNQSKQTVEIAKSTIPQFFSYNQSEEIDTTNDIGAEGFITKIQSEKESISGENIIKLIIPTKIVNEIKENISAYDFLSFINTNAPSALKRSLYDEYMFGVHKINSKGNIFMVLKTSDYNIAYAGMLNWEKTLLDDLHLLINVSTSGENEYLKTTTWRDIVVNNKDVRVISDNEGNGLLYYMFIDREYFLITDSIDTIKEINSRFMIKNIKPN